MLSLVLIVDDHRDIRAMLCAALSLQGYQVRAVAGGEEALAWIKAGQSPDLILLDLEMPGMDGYTFLDHVASLQAEGTLKPVPMVLMTAGAVRSVLSPIPVLQKPFSLQELFALFRRLLASDAQAVNKSG